MEDSLTVVFEDRGQDFLEWDLERDESVPTDYVVVGCRPFQEWFWKGTKVHTDFQDCGPGACLDITTPLGNRTHLKYPTIEVK